MCVHIYMKIIHTHTNIGGAPSGSGNAARIGGANLRSKGRSTSCACPQKKKTTRGTNGRTPHDTKTRAKTVSQHPPTHTHTHIICFYFNICMYTGNATYIDFSECPSASGGGNLPARVHTHTHTLTHTTIHPHTSI